MSVKINLNPGVRTVYAKSLNDVRANVVKDGMGFDDVDQLADAALEYDTKQSATAKQKNLANFLGALSDASAGRGVNKTTFGPAHARGYHLNNPQYFGLENKAPVPYDKMLTNTAHLRSVMSGFQETKNAGGSIPSDAASVLA